ncbi:MAG TPA: hypothetical protein PLW42_12365 [Anaerohalosphaeraceae bacterium]|nr:hypothetical protein [Anaerohalosphaeraceae bacterium]
MPYSDEFIFYKLLDQKVELGYTVAITFPSEKMQEESGLYKRVSCCSNGKEFFDKMADLAKIAIDAYKHLATKDIFGLWKAATDLTQRNIYAAYKVEYSFDENTSAYFLLLEPIGEGRKDAAWRFMA